MKPMVLKLARTEKGGISVRSWISDPAKLSEGFEGMELYNAKDDPSLTAYFGQLLSEGYDVTVVERESLDARMQRAISEGLAGQAG